MAVSKDILGMNARNFLYIRRYNPPRSKRIADNKLATKQLLIQNSIPTPALLTTFGGREDIRDFDWQLPESGFCIKPARGYGGSGILVLRGWRNRIGKTLYEGEYDLNAIESHLLDILDGAYSLQYLPDVAFIEERVIRHPFFKKITPVGVPDIRIIVFNHIPIMAMLRLPTEESQGKANIHLGAIAVGIDLKTGITTQAIANNKPVRTIPGLKVKTRGIKVPFWDEILLLAAQTQGIIGLGYAGIDIVLDKYKGPMVLEVNARPGLSIQIANMASLRTRLERVENMGAVAPKRGVEVGQSLFAEPFSEKVASGPQVLSYIEPVTLRYKGKEKEVFAKLDTGAFRTSIDAELALELGILVDKKHARVLVKAANSEQLRPAVPITLVLAGRRITTTASIANRTHLRYPVIIGRQDLKGVLVNPFPGTMFDDDEDLG